MAKQVTFTSDEIVTVVQLAGMVDPATLSGGDVERFVAAIHKCRSVCSREGDWLSCDNFAVVGSAVPYG